LIKETDAYVLKYNNKGKVTSKQPIRMVMNNKTFSLFEDENYQNNLHTFQLDTMEFSRSKQWCCVNLKDSLFKFKLCGFEALCGPRDKNIWAEDWASAYLLFKGPCYSGITLLRPHDLKDLNDTYIDRMQRLKLEIETKKERILEENLEKKNVKILGGRIKKLEDLGYQALGREIDVEEMLKKEEKERENMEMKHLLKKIDLETKKKECMDKKVKEKELEEKKLLDIREAKTEMKKQKKEIKLDVELKRIEMKRQIQYMRRRAKRKRAELEQKLQLVRAKMAKSAMKNNKMGNIELCRKGKASSKARLSYCDANFITDYIRNQDCKDTQQFCYICCETEFGNMYLVKREECYDMCDEEAGAKKKNKKKPGKKGADGKWIWVKKSKGKSVDMHGKVIR